MKLIKKLQIGAAVRINVKIENVKSNRARKEIREKR